MHTDDETVNGKLQFLTRQTCSPPSHQSVYMTVHIFLVSETRIIVHINCVTRQGKDPLHSNSSQGSWFTDSFLPNKPYQLIFKIFLCFSWLHWVFAAAWAFSSCGWWRILLLPALRRLVAVASLAKHRLEFAGSVVAAHGFGCSAARGLFPDQGSNPCPLHLPVIPIHCTPREVLWTDFSKMWNTM